MGVGLQPRRLITPQIWFSKTPLISSPETRKNLSSSIFQPIIGRWIDSDKAEQAALGLTGDDLVLKAGQATLSTMIIFPAILIVAFTILYFWVKSMKSSEAD